MTIINKILAYLRLVKIQEIKNEREHLENVLFDAWKNYGQCNYSQRIEAIKSVIERVKIDSSTKVHINKELVLKSENDNDKAKNISFFGML